MRADVKREVERMLADGGIRMPRFFRDNFDYDPGGNICTDSMTLANTGASTRGTAHYRAMFDASASIGRLIELILHERHVEAGADHDKVVVTGCDKS